MRKGRVMRAAAILGIMLAAGSAAETKATESRMVLAEEEESETESEMSADDALIEKQNGVDEALQQELENGYTLEDALIVVNPYGTAPLSAMAVFSTEEALGGTVTVKGKSQENDVIGTFEAETDHMVPIYGLYSGQATEVVITLDDGTTTTFSVETEPVNVDLGTIQADMIDESSYDYSELTFVCSAMGALYALDGAGDMRFYTNMGGALGVHLLRNGHLCIPSSEVLHPTYYKDGLLEIDLMGKIYQKYDVPGGQHHDFVELPNGNLLIASDREDFSTVEDYVVEINRKSGKVVWELDMKDLISEEDGQSASMDSDGSEETDWFHNNGLWYDAEHDLVLLSARHKDAIVAVKKEEKELAWILGDPTGWENVDASCFFTPQGETFEWFYAQHNVSLLDNGDICLFDNGTAKVKRADKEKRVSGDEVYSRAVIYRIDTENMTVSQVFQYGKERGADWYSDWISGVESLDGTWEHLWITAGSHLHNEAENRSDYYPKDMFEEGLTKTTHIDQVDNGKLTYELTISGNSYDVLTYRSFRMPLYSEYRGKNTYGYYGQKVTVSGDLKNRAAVLENDAASAQIETTIPVEQTRVATSYAIDQQLQAEQENGYSWEEPMTIVNPYQIAPLTAVILFDTPEACAVRFTVKGKTEAADITGEVEAAVSHRVPVIGLYPGIENTVVLELLDADGNATDSQEVKISTEVLPDQLTDSIYPVKTSGISAYELTMVYGQRTHLPFAYDCMGDIRWYMNIETANYGLYLLSNNRMIWQDTAAYVPNMEKPQSTNLYEMDYLGRAYTMYYLAGGSHHEVIEKEPGGNLLVLTSSLQLHYENVIQEIDRQTGKVVNELVLEDLLDCEYVDRADWVHVNTVSYQPESDTILISARNLESVIKLNWTTKEIQWILCDPRFWEGTEYESYVLQPEGEFVYHFQQHTAYEMEEDMDGNPDTIEISMYDNHYVKERKSKLDYYDNDDASYLLVYSVDEAAGTVRQIKKIPTIYSKITSSMIYDSESGHVFGMCGWVPRAEDKRKGMTYEFDYDTEEILNQFSIKTTFYRACEMQIDYNDLAASMKLEENTIRGELIQPVKVTDPENVTAPQAVISQENVTLHLTGSVLYVGTLDHQVSQIVFRGAEHTYVYDTTQIVLRVADYLQHYEHLPVPLQNLEPDEYNIYVMYQDRWCDTGQNFTKI